ncbi:MAG: hypothetical protein JWO38_5609 [Gemmataceae bacterium]|nr:hypothetical protein [Gemmataceae bacterium]
MPSAGVCVDVRLFTCPRQAVDMPPDVFAPEGHSSVAQGGSPGAAGAGLGFSAAGHGAAFFPPFGLGTTSTTFSFGFLANGLYSGSPTRTVIQLQNSIDRP